MASLADIPRQEMNVAENKKKRKPDYRLKVLDKESGKSGQAGAGWKNEDGSISISLDLCIVLPGGNPNLVITLFPADEKK